MNLPCAQDPIEVDFLRAAWLPDDWGQGVKITKAVSRSRPGQGGTLTIYVGPCGKSFYHKAKVEEYVGRTLSVVDGFQGQVRLAQIQAAESVQLARMEIKEMKKEGAPNQIGTDDEQLMALLSTAEKKLLGVSIYA